MFKFIKALYTKAVKLAMSIFDIVKSNLTEVTNTTVEMEVIDTDNTVVIDQPTMTNERADAIANKVVAIVGKVALAILALIIVDNFFYLILVSTTVYYTYKFLNHCVKQTGESLI